MKNVPKDVIQNVDTHLTVGAEPLLTHLTAEVEFAEVMLLELHVVSPRLDTLFN